MALIKGGQPNIVYYPFPVAKPLSATVLSDANTVALYTIGSDGGIRVWQPGVNEELQGFTQINNQGYWVIPKNIDFEWSDVLSVNSNNVAPVYSTALEDFNSTSYAGVDGVSVTLSAPNTNVKFEFSGISGAGGFPLRMSLYVDGVAQAVVDYLSAYKNTFFRFTDTNGVIHSTVGNSFARFLEENGRIDF